MNYSSTYDLPLLRDIRGDKPWDLLNEIKQYLRPDYTLLDIGCGTAVKTLKLAKHVSKIYGIEPSPNMFQAALQNIERCNVKNCVLVDSQSDDIPFPNDSFDVVTCMLAPHNTFEVHRVLKPGGYAIIEKLGDRDKWNIKECFGQDSIGLRGRFGHFNKGQRSSTLENEFKLLFREVSIRNEFWKTSYSLESLLAVLEQTPTVRNFDRYKDSECIEEVQRKYTVDGRIDTMQNRILICAQK